MSHSPTQIRHDAQLEKPLVSPEVLSEDDGEIRMQLTQDNHGVQVSSNETNVSELHKKALNSNASPNGLKKRDRIKSFEVKSPERHVQGNANNQYQ